MHIIHYILACPAGYANYKDHCYHYGERNIVMDERFFSTCSRKAQWTEEGNFARIDERVKDNFVEELTAG